MKTRRWIGPALFLVVLATGQTASSVDATGGDSTNEAGGYRTHVFLNSGSLIVSGAGDVEVLVVAGGGGGGGDIGGGGGAGGLIYSNAFPVTPGSITVTVGGGGAGGAPSATGSTGTNSAFGSLTAYGGGGGGAWNVSNPTGGGSGGGGQAGPVAGALGTNGQGNAGGNGGPTGTSYPGGGGGGAGSAGTNGTATDAGQGGVGREFSQFAAVGGFPAGWFAGGGGGGVYNNQGPEGQGGNGGGGMGGKRAAVSNPGTNGVANTGGGGGGASRVSPFLSGGAGGSGIVIVKYQLSSAPVIQNLAATNVTTSSAWLNGYIAFTGGAPVTAVSVYWGATDGGNPTNGLWPYTNAVSGGPWTNGAVATYQATTLTSNTTYYYRYAASNALGLAGALSSASFVPGALTVLATVPNCSESPGSPGSFTVYRPNVATNADLVVHYALSGAASNGTDYLTLSSNVTIGAGFSNASVVVSPIFELNPESSENVVLTLTPGTYVIGSPSNATVTIADALAFTQTVVNAWTGTGNWNSAANWSLVRVPAWGDDVQVAGDVTLTNPTPVLSAFTLNSGTFTSSNNWDVYVAASNILIAAGTVTHVPQSDAAAPWVPDSRVYFRCVNLTLASGATIDVSGKGYAGGLGSDIGCGPGGGPNDFGPYGAGGGYGGSGGYAYWSTTYGPAYGTASSPNEPGSGGGGGTGNGGAGGGYVRIEATQQALINGAIRANGVYGGGSGGGIYVSCRTLAGGGLFAAQGGTYKPNSACGGGGRIAIFVDGAAQSTAPHPSIQYMAARGVNSGSEYRPYSSRPGTIYLSSFDLLTETLQGGEVIVPGVSTWAPNNLTITNGLAVMTNRWRIAVTNNMLVAASGGLELTNAVLTVGSNLTLSSSEGLYLWAAPGETNPFSVGRDLTIGGGTLAWHACPTTIVTVPIAGNLTMTNTGSFYVYSAITNGGLPAYGAWVRIGGDIVLATNSWIYSLSHPTNGGSVMFTFNNVSILTTNSGFSADSGGFGGSYGPGIGGYSGNQAGGGGGYGGMGGTGSWAGGPIAFGGPTYGSTSQPLLVGSSGAGSGFTGGTGGGLLWLLANGRATLNGTLRANGGVGYNGSAGGSGGGIYLTCTRLAGTSAVLTANGGNGTPYGTQLGGGGGGGGRIAIWRMIDKSDTNAWQIQVSGGLGASTTNADGSTNTFPGNVGTVYWGSVRNPGTVFVVH